jgi:sulfofructosephosphate aldolase
VTLDSLARPSGTFLMVAMDQRESLRALLGDDADDDALVRFKLAVARELGPYASGFLIDREYGFDAVARERVLPSGCGLLLAADALVQEPGGPVEDTKLDPDLDAAAAAGAGAVGLKLLVVWRDDERREERVELAHRFVEVCAGSGLLSVLEGVVRADDRDAAIVEAAHELAAVGPSLYKVEVPMHGRGDRDELVRRCAEIDAAVAVPWVVLSNGVAPEDFPAAVEAACRAGASGMLAGRAVWTAAIGAADTAAALREHAVPRLERLAGIVDRHGRSWRDSAA